MHNETGGVKPWDARLVEWMSRGSGTARKRATEPRDLILGGVSGVCVGIASHSVGSAGVVTGALILIALVRFVVSQIAARLRLRGR